MRRALPFLLPALLAVLLAVYGIFLFGGRLSAESHPVDLARPAAKAAKPAADPAGITATSKAAADDKSAKPANLTSQQVLRRLMQRTEAVQGRTAAGLTIQQAPPFKVLPRIDKLEYYPCSDCHADQQTNPKPRVLKDEHVNLDFQHGGGRFWCYACHNPGDMDHLRLLDGQLISFNDAYKLCGECHFQRQKDWYFGGHGKRAGTWRDPRKIPLTHAKMSFKDRKKIGTWRGPRVLLDCTECHDAHSPSIKPYKPSPPPKVRKGLERPDIEMQREPTIWNEVKHEEAKAQ